MKHIFISAVLLIVVSNAFALDPIFTPWQNNLAIRGFDPVAYFLEDKAVKGSKDFKWEWQEATWQFASNEHKELFMNNPEAYAPQYGGYCAYAVAQNSTASVDPEQFAIVEGKLYLNYNKKIQQRWLGDISKFIEDADKNWPGLLKK
jgi:YHS domain-containing protein